MSYPDSVRYLYALGNELKVGAKFDLDRMRVLLSALGNPEQTGRFVHVAGTNGKGSTCAMIANALNCAGLKTGLYTSPHLVEPTERIQINGKPVTPSEFATTFEVLHAKAEELIKSDILDAHPSYFETVTAMAFLLFRQRTQLTVLEVGLGGRLDATNVVRPELCVITPVSYDHEAFLGNTLESIAREKAGILKPGVPVVLAPQAPEAQCVILQRAAELKCRIIPHREPCAVVVAPRRSSFTLDGEQYVCALPGRHQVENAVTAVIACKELGLATPNIQQGLATVRWPGRLEYVSESPDFVLDGAHNPAGAVALASYIREFCMGRPVWIVYGAMRDKAIEEVAGQLFARADKVIATAPQYARALRPQVILQTVPHPNATIVDTVAQAIDEARSAPKDAIAFFTGSLFLVGEARALLVK